MKDGGAAFPIPPDFIGQHGETARAYEGMTLLDYFAGQALTGIEAAQTEQSCIPSSQQRASLAYDDAEAMIAEREKRLARKTDEA